MTVVASKIEVIVHLYIVLKRKQSRDIHQRTVDTLLKVVRMESNYLGQVSIVYL